VRAGTKESLPPEVRRAPGYSYFVLHAPSSPLAAVYIALLCLVLSVLFWYGVGPTGLFLPGLVFVFLIPAFVGALGVPPLARALGGRMLIRRAMFLTTTSLMIVAPIALVWRTLVTFDMGIASSAFGVLLLMQGPILWFRHMSLFGVSNPRHARTLPTSLLQPLLSSVAALVLYHPAIVWYIAAALFLVFGFLSCALLLSASDRPLRREFGVSGVALIRPLLDHVSGRDPAATASLEAFFRRFSIPADLRVTILSFFANGHAKATVALPTVHPGPFASLGASDLPRKLGERLGPESGTVFVPHTPCNHDLDLPSGQEVDRVAEATRELFGELTVPPEIRSSRLVSPREGSLARAQFLGGTALVVVSQAPAPTDDIQFAIADQIFRHFQERGGPSVALIDAHNSYVEDEGDLSYGTPLSEQLVADAQAAVEMARSQSQTGVIEVGVAVKDGYSIGGQGIGPHGIRALVVRAAGQLTAYVLIDGNNLLRGLRRPILDALQDLVDAAEVMTTDNHVVHEVDGGVNPVGERLGVEPLIRDIRETVTRAIADLAPVEPRSGTKNILDVRVLQPAWTVRLLTSLGDTFVLFATTLTTTFILLLMTSLVVLLALGA
jgi:putative membrane protein